MGAVSEGNIGCCELAPVDDERERATAAADAGGSADSVKVGTPLSVRCVADAFGVVCGEESSSVSCTCTCTCTFALSFSVRRLLLLFITGSGGGGMEVLSSSWSWVAISIVGGEAATATEGAAAAAAAVLSSPAVLLDGGGSDRVVGGCSIFGSPRHSDSRVSIRGGLLMAT